MKKDYHAGKHIITATLSRQEYNRLQILRSITGIKSNAALVRLLIDEGLDNRQVSVLSYKGSAHADHTTNL